MTLLDVASAQQIPLRGLEVTIDSKMAAAAETSKLSWERRLRISKMSRQIRVNGSLTDEQRDTLLRGADYCPVDNTLAQPVELETTVTVIDE